MPVTELEAETETQPNGMKPEETKTATEELLEKLTPEARSALEAMRRIARLKKVQLYKLPETRYFRLE